MLLFVGLVGLVVMIYVVMGSVGEFCYGLLIVVVGVVVIVVVLVVME